MIAETIPSSMSRRRSILLRWSLWSFVVLVFLALNLVWQNQEHREMAISHARSLYQKDLAFRVWNARMGGVYVQVQEHLQPNPYLKVPDRDVTTTSGKELTLVNPAYMVRLATEGCPATKDIRSHLTSLRPIRPENAPDPWERRALESLAQGASEVVESSDLDGSHVLRYMAPMRMEESCLKCHGTQGYKVGDLRGGLSESVPFDPLFSFAFLRTHSWDILILAGLWGSGLGLIGLFTRWESKKELQRERTEQALKESEAGFRNLFESAGDPIFILGFEGRFLDINSAACAHLGYTREELLLLGPMDIDAPESAAQVTENLRILHEKGHLLVETHQIRKDGGKVAVEINARVINYQGQPAVLSFARDLTARNEAEAEMRRLASFPEESPNTILEFDAAGMETYHNAAASAALQRAHLPQDFSIFLPADLDTEREPGPGEPSQRYHELELGEMTYGVWTQFMKEQGTIRIYATDITLQKKAVLSLAASEKRFRDLVTMAQEGIWAVDANAITTYANPRMGELLGYTPEEMVGCSLYDFMEPSQVPQARENIRRRSLGFQDGHDFPLRHRDGRTLTLRVESGPLWDDQGHFAGAIAMITDVTRQKRLETELRDSEARYRYLFESMAQGAVFQDHTGIITFANPAAERILGLNLEQMRGITSMDPRWRSIREDGSPFPGESHPAMVALATGQPVREVTMGVYHPAEARFHWILINAQPEFREGDERPFRVFTTFQDITRLKDAQDAVRRLNENLEDLVRDRTLELEQAIARLQQEISVREQAESALRAAEEKNRALLDAIPDLLFMQDADGVLLDWKGNASDLFAPPEQFLGRRVRDVLPPEVAELIERKIREALETQSLQTFEYDLAAPGAGTRRFEARMIPGGRMMVISLVRDVTERWRHDVLERDHATLAAKSRMAAYLAHEINNPLAGIKHSFEVLATAIPADHEDFQFVGTIRRELERIAGIIRTAYALHRPGPPRLRETSVPEILTDLSRLLLPRFRAKHVALELSDCKEGSRRKIHEDLLRQVLFNVLQNALEASPTEGVIQCRAREEGLFVVVDVEDQGPGISPELARRIFEPGFTTKTAPEMGGLGLGLNTCKNLLEAVNGSISFINLEPGPGTCFTIRLPWQD